VTFEIVITPLDSVGIESIWKIQYGLPIPSGQDTRNKEPGCNEVSNGVVSTNGVSATLLIDNSSKLSKTFPTPVSALNSPVDGVVVYGS
jgi:hypothetical protein